MRRRAGAALLLLALTASGCRDVSPTVTARVLSHQDRWQQHEPDRYEYTLTYGSMIGPRSERIQVDRGRVVRATPVDGERGFLPNTDDALTVDGVFDLVRQDQKRADQVDVTYDDQWDFPASVSVDSIKAAIDDEYGYGVSQFVALSGDLPEPTLDLLSGVAACRDPLVRGAKLRRVFFMKLAGTGQARLRILDGAGRDLIDPLTVSHGELEPRLRPARGTTAMPSIGRVLLTAGSTVLVDKKERLTPRGVRC